MCVCVCVLRNPQFISHCVMIFAVNLAFIMFFVPLKAFYLPSFVRSTGFGIKLLVSVTMY